MRSADGDAGHELEREVVPAVGLPGVEQADEMAVLDRAAPRAPRAATGGSGPRRPRYSGLSSLSATTRAGLRVRGAEDLAHAALAEDRLDAIWPDGVAHPSHPSRITVPGLTAGRGTLDSRVVRRSRKPWIGVLVATCTMAPIPVAGAVTDQAPTPAAAARGRQDGQRRC